MSCYWNALTGFGKSSFFISKLLHLWIWNQTRLVTNVWKSLKLLALVVLAPSLLKPFIFIVFEGLKQIESINKFNIYTLNRVDGKQIYDHPFTILEALSLS